MKDDEHKVLTVPELTYVRIQNRIITNTLWKVIPITILFAVGCGREADTKREEITDTTREEITDFLQSDRFIEAAQLEIEAMEEWDYLMFNTSEFTPSEGKEHVAKLEVKLAKAYDKLGELIPPKCLRSTWNKQVEVAQLYFQACGLLNSKFAGKSTIDSQQLLDKMNALIYKANDLKTEATQEMEDICNEYDIDFVGSELDQ